MTNKEIEYLMSKFEEFRFEDYIEIINKKTGKTETIKIYREQIDL